MSARRLVVLIGALVALTAALVACGGSSTKRAARSDAPSTTAASASSPVTSAPSTTSDPAAVPHFDTPEGSMQYLAKAWNAGDDVSLRHVTTPDGRAQLDGMRSFAENLRFDRCEARADVGDYLCYFDHDDKPGTVGSVSGRPAQLEVVAGPADKQGWYMTVYVSCGG